MDSPELYMYRSVIGLFATEQGFAFQWIGGYENVQSSVACFAMIDKTRPQPEAEPEGEVAGMHMPFYGSLVCRCGLPHYGATMSLCVHRDEGTKLRETAIMADISR